MGRDGAHERAGGPDGEVAVVGQREVEAPGHVGAAVAEVPSGEGGGEVR